MNKLIEYVCEKLMNWCVRRGRVLNITGSGGPDDIYLIRYYVIKSKYFNFWLHQFLRSDRDDLHDHPWDFMTYLVRGAYDEHKWNAKTLREDAMRRTNYTPSKEVIDSLAEFLPNIRTLPKKYFRQNRLVFRRAEDQHKVLVSHDLKASDRARAPLTICITGPARREWGFIKMIYSSSDGREYRVWVPWREYLNLPANEPSRG